MKSPLTTTRKAPASLRWGVRLLSILLTFLFIFLLGFVLDDIGDLDGPNWNDVRQNHVAQTLIERTEVLDEEIRTLDVQIRRQEEIQQTLQRSMNNARETMDQMMALYRLSIERSIQPNETEQTALAESQTRFLDAQERYETANSEISALNQQKFELTQERADIERQITAQEEPAREEFRELTRAHQFKVASLKLAFVVPLLALAGILTKKFRESPYLPVFLAGLAAAFWKVGVVMFHHFPREFFRYIAIGAAIAIVLSFLVWILKRIARPDEPTLINRYREAYTNHQCPVCAYPIARGAFKFATWTRKGPRLPLISNMESEKEFQQPYACPSCGTLLFQKCEKCGQQRHSLLPYCEQCGGKKEMAEIA